MSDARSFKGYSWKVWFVKNKGNLKLLLVAVIGLLTFFSSEASPELSVVLAGFLTALSKLGVDALDYWLQD
jgi:hypothetical protein